MAVYIHVDQDLLQILIRCMMMHVFIFIHIYIYILYIYIIYKCVLWCSPRMPVASEGLEGSLMSLVRLVSWGISSNTYYIYIWCTWGWVLRVLKGTTIFPMIFWWMAMCHKSSQVPTLERRLWLNMSHNKILLMPLGRWICYGFFWGGKWPILAKGHIHPAIVNFGIFLRCMMIWWDFWCL